MHDLACLQHCRRQRCRTWNLAPSDTGRFRRNCKYCRDDNRLHIDGIGLSMKLTIRDIVALLETIKPGHAKVRVDSKTTLLQLEPVLKHGVYERGGILDHLGADGSAAFFLIFQPLDDDSIYYGVLVLGIVVSGRGELQGGPSIIALLLDPITECLLGEVDSNILAKGAEGYCVVCVLESADEVVIDVEVQF